MRVTLLGTGTALPTSRRVQSGALVESDDRSRRVLVDCGSGVLHRLPQADTGVEDVDAALITHTHLDHVADLASLVKARVLAGTAEFLVVGPPGIDAALDNLLAVDDVRERADLTVQEIDAGPVDVAGFDVTAFEADHSKPTLGYRFDGDGTNDGDAADGRDGGGTSGGGTKGGVTFSGDTTPSETVAEAADGSAVLVHDCAHPDGGDVENHATPSGLGGVLAGRDVGRVYLTHLYPDTHGMEGAMTATVEGRFDGEVMIANDLETFEV
ncbi:MBL fold metallo-hydrolase [Halostella sp. JP-L12]|uniref:MBL fold metallo-hydrolase n=1 Tax=Halostella TaxID=1843185 RepID=UPI000EF7AA8C|nr:MULTISPECIES: MBL fold metallo-hydrolase [Halostella]NHN48696.1 MBL fold metallo-hydrolase [Halostella sp. JP-L12]